MSTNIAWVLPLDGYLAAVGERLLAHVVSAPESFDIPWTPPYCRRVIVWEGDALPVMDLAARLEDRAAHPDLRWVAVVAYQTGQEEAVRYGGLQLSAPPIRLRVEDEQACPIPRRPELWSRIAMSCFVHAGSPVPILDLPTLFSRRPTGDLDDRAVLGVDQEAGLI